MSFINAKKTESMTNKGSFLIVFILIWLSTITTGCAGRKVFKARTTSVAVDSIRETGQRTIIQKGEKIVFVPKLKYKDTTIVIRRKNIISRVTYDKKGAVKQVDCEQEFKKLIENGAKENTIKKPAPKFKMFVIIFSFL